MFDCSTNLSAVLSCQATGGRVASMVREVWQWRQRGATLALDGWAVNERRPTKRATRVSRGSRVFRSRYFNSTDQYALSRKVFHDWYFSSVSGSASGCASAFPAGGSGPCAPVSAFGLPCGRCSRCTSRPRFPSSIRPPGWRHDVVQERGRDYITDKEIREAVRWLDSLDQQ
jgi:hypothetical protein